MSHNYDDVIDWIRQDLTIRTVAVRAGMNELAARRLVNRLVEEHNLTYNPQHEDRTPYGLTRNSHPLRVELGMKLYDLKEKLKGDRVQVARLTGLNRSEQIRAENIPFDHPWTIPQIERLAQVYGLTFTEILNASSD